MSEKKPSQIFDSYWVYTSRKKGNYPKNTVRSGKWLIFVPFSEVDEWWDLIKIYTDVNKGMKVFLGRYTSPDLKTSWSIVLTRLQEIYEYCLKENPRLVK